ncbi:MAG: RnfABCDGE type electron transport complex subunit C [Candidatus Omnitrophica bacterium]|nr:RnfABCDGE type electron transport complex subunit C [Candidatus Omnitrophota bacterium]
MRGIKLDGKKDPTLITWTIKRLRQPARVRIALRQGGRDLAVPCVRHDDSVKAGQVIALPADDFSTPLHASVSGKVMAVGTFAHPFLEDAQAIEIVGDGRGETAPGVGTERLGWESLDRAQLAPLFRQAGLVTMDEAMVPLHVLAQESLTARVRTLVINLCEPEPYVTSEQALAMSHALEIIQGAEILRKAFGAEKITAVLTEDKIQAAELLKSKIYFLKWGHVDVRVLPLVYPQGLDVPLAETLLERKLKLPAEWHRGGTPQDKGLALHRVFRSEGLEILNGASAFAAHEAIVLQKPLFERAVTVGGECVMEPKNLWAPLGLSFQDVFKAAKGLMRDPAKVIAGGPMQGRFQAGLEAMLVKGIPALLALPPEAAPDPAASACIHCGLCIDVCPENLSPVMITLASESGLYEEAASWNAADCIRCGNCTYICPSKRPMDALIDRAIHEQLNSESRL